MEKSEVYKISMDKLKDFVTTTSSYEIDLLIKKSKDLNIEGPTYSEYLQEITAINKALNGK